MQSGNDEFQAPWVPRHAEDLAKVKAEMAKTVPELAELKKVYSDVDDAVAVTYLSYVVIFLGSVLQRFHHGAESKDAIDRVVRVLERSLDNCTASWREAVYQGFVEMSTDFRQDGPFVRRYFGPHLTSMWDKFMELNPGYVDPV